ncbi:sodium:solute symporter family transporter [Mycolicibacterium vaccae]|uniref:Na+/solute symporter n=1 Tax=Mycolicibacterium vaccae ATCC 25954 TaxID=1194972 RepID=K0UPU6_MYCVA|nr:sodium:solute symporter [Mycolicibacterium vaccae]ANI37471.1 sodium:solute symporter [Mycolicibacterium vaccae 95051]EJZ07035.1 Na+/solute symporter [Mycolicibacterium vaccae ATCC 25954]
MIITGVAIFLVILTVSGVVSARRVRGDTTNYLVAGRALPAVLVTAVLIAQPVDSNATIGNADLSAAFGFWAGAALPIGLALCLFLMGLFFAKRLRTTNVVTLPEYFRSRFGPAIEVVASWLTVGSFVILLAGNLVAIGFLLERFLGISYATGILLTIPLALLYTITGGMFASVYTGVAQVVVNVVAVAALVIWVATTHGFSAPEGFGADNLSQLTSAESGAVINWATIIALGLGNLVAIDLMQRVFSANSPGAAQRACFAASAGILLLCLPLSFVALAAVSIVGDASADGPILFTLLADYAPAWLAIIVISGLLAATLTTVSGILLSTASVLVRNVFRVDEGAAVMTHRILTATRWTTLPIAALAAVVALRVPQTGILLTLAFDLLLASLVVPFVLGLYWRRGGAAAAVAAVVVGIGVRLTFFVLTPTIYGVDNTLLYVPNESVSTTWDGWSTLLAGAASLLAYVVVALRTGTPAAGEPAPQVTPADRSAALSGQP